MDNKLRSDLPPLPANIARLPVDERGYPIPWFVAFVDGKPEFRAADGKKFFDAVRLRLCWVCGQQIPATECLTFVLGPMCIVNRTTAEPPCHQECAEFSIRACPFLTKPHMTRRENDMPKTGEVAGHMIRRNPGASATWMTDHYRIFGDGRGGQLFRIGNPIAVKWWSEGRPATRAEVMASFESGLPILHDLAVKESPAAVKELERMAADARALLPA